MKDEFVAAIKEHEGIIYKISKVYAIDNHDQQDLYQEIVYQLWKSFAGFKMKSKLSTWIYRVALNTSISYMNRRIKRQNYSNLDINLMEAFSSFDKIKNEQIELLYAHIKRLSVVEKGIILLYLEEKTHEEIAQITGFSPTNVGTRISRIKSKLKTAIIKN